MPLTPTLYLTRNGLLEPLGHSQVLAYLRGLSKDYKITLISYEKADDWADKAVVARVRAVCETHGINWLPQQFRAQPKIVAPAISMVRMVWLVVREVRRNKVRLIHARSYIPSAVALVAGRLTGVPFLFDMRALWPEELITAGRIKRGSFIHRAIVRAERACLSKSAGVISLTHAAVKHLKNVYPAQLNTQRISVIPTCADLNRFKPAKPTDRTHKVHSCIGTVLSGWFLTDWLAAWLAAASAHDPEARFEIITRDDAQKVRSAIDPDDSLASRLSISPRNPEDMPEAVQQHDLSVMFFTEGISKLGSSPTRMAEILGSGLPVIANDGVGDVALIVKKYRVGVLVEGPEPAHMRAAIKEFDTLMADTGLAQRCRKAAQEVFSLEAGTHTYAELYASVLTPSKVLT